MLSEDWKGKVDYCFLTVFLLSWRQPDYGEVFYIFYQFPFRNGFRAHRGVLPKGKNGLKWLFLHRLFHPLVHFLFRISIFLRKRYRFLRPFGRTFACCLDLRGINKYHSY